MNREEILKIAKHWGFSGMEKVLETKSLRLISKGIAYVHNHPNPENKAGLLYVFLKNYEDKQIKDNEYSELSYIWGDRVVVEIQDFINTIKHKFLTYDRSVEDLKNEFRKKVALTNEIMGEDFFWSCILINFDDYIKEYYCSEIE